MSQPPFTKFPPAQPIELRATRVVLPAAVPAANLTNPVAFDFLCEWVSHVGPRAVDLQLDTRINAATTDGFPANVRINLPAGARYNGANVWDANGDLEGCAIVKIELGAGPDPRVIYCDLRHGRYSLGAQTWVRVSVARWLASGSGPSYDVYASVAAHTDGSAEHLTYTACTDAVPAAGSRIMTAPPGACWLEIYPAQPGYFDVVSTDPPAMLSASRNSDPLTGFYAPPWSPLPFLGAGISITNRGGAANGCTAIFWVK